MRILLFLFTILVMLLGCTKSAYYQEYVPPAANVDGIERIAVADFEGLSRSGKIIALKLAEGIVDGGYFQLFERDQLDRILDEKEFNQTEWVDPATVSDLKLHGVDALIFGVVDAYSVDQQTGITKVERQVGTGRYRTVEREGENGETETIEEEIMETILIDRGYILHEGTVAVTFRMANINTGEIVAVKTETATFSKKTWEDEKANLPTKDAILDGLAQQVTGRFLHQVQPSYVSRRVNFEKTDTPPTERAIAYAQSGLWDKAYGAFRQATVAAPHDAAAHYNLAIACNVLGWDDEAEAAIEAAINLEPKEKYMRWLAQMRREADAEAARR